LLLCFDEPQGLQVGTLTQGSLSANRETCSGCKVSTADYGRAVFS